jgi:uncharacterized membrane protein
VQASHTRLAPRIRMNRAIPPSRIVIVRIFAFNLYEYDTITEAFSLRMSLCNYQIYSFFSNLSYDRSTVSSKTIPPLNAI